jgi:hypothetical protein
VFYRVLFRRRQLGRAELRTGVAASSPMELFGFAGITPRHRGMERFMSRKKAGTGSYVEIFWEFLRDNPELATMIAFELGSLAGTVVRTSGGKKYLKNGAKKVPQALSDAMSPALANALKFLPGPNLQPNKKPAAKRRSQKAKPAAKHAA